MLIVQVHIHVKSEMIDAFVEATRVNAQNSVLEPGIVRFDVFQQQDDPTRFILSEVYKDLDAPYVHKNTDHYAKWRDAVVDMMVEPRYSIKYDNIFPVDKDW